MSKISIRNAGHDDLAEIIRVEESWPESSRASEEAFAARIEKFAEGFYLAMIEGEQDKEIAVATITTMPMNFSDLDIHEISSWEKLTNNGYLQDFKVESCNTLYIVSGVIDQNYRGHNIFAPMVMSVVELASKLGMRYVLAGAVMPGYKKYCIKNGDVSAFEYTRLRRGNHLVDPLLDMYESIDFYVPNERHVIDEYYPDDASKNYAALVLRDLLSHPVKHQPG